MKRKQLQKKQFSLLGFAICFFVGHNKVKGVFTDEIGLKYSGKCSRCGSLYGEPFRATAVFYYPKQVIN